MILNKTKNKVICKNKRFLITVFAKAMGLMFSRPIHDEGYIFVFESSRKIDLHMFFVFFPIDVLFLDSKKTIVEMKENFSPFTLYSSNKEMAYFIELPAGKIKDSNTTIGDLIEF